MDNPGVVGAFYLLSGVTVLSSLAVFAVRNLLHAVVFLVLAFVGMAGIFITLSADFLAVAQILIYAGAVSILLVFAVMLTPLADRNNANSLFVLPGVAVAGGFATCVLPFGTQISRASDIAPTSMGGTTRTDTASARNSSRQISAA